MAALCVRDVGCEYCPFHPDQRVMLECKTCPGTLVCVKCLNGDHSGHTVSDINKAVTEKKQEMERYIKKTEKMVPEIPKKITSVLNSLGNKQDVNDRTIHSIKSQGTVLKELIDVQTTCKISEVVQVKEANEKIAEDYTDVLKSLLLYTQRDTRDFRRIVGIDNNILAYDRCFNTSAELPRIPEQPNFTECRFTDCKSPNEYLEKAMGVLNLSGNHKSELAKLEKVKANCKAKADSKPMKPFQTDPHCISKLPKEIQKTSIYMDMPIQLQSLVPGMTVASICCLPGTPTRLCLLDNVKNEIMLFKPDVNRYTIKIPSTVPYSVYMFIRSRERLSVQPRKTDVFTKLI